MGWLSLLLFVFRNSEAYCNVLREAHKEYLERKKERERREREPESGPKVKKRDKICNNPDSNEDNLPLQNHKYRRPLDEDHQKEKDFEIVVLEEEKESSGEEDEEEEWYICETLKNLHTKTAHIYGFIIVQLYFSASQWYFMLTC